MASAVLESVESIIIRLFERSDQALTRRQLHDLGEAGDTLLRWGTLRQDQTLTSLGCRSCGEDHLVDLEYEPELRIWRYYCSSVGFVAVDAADLVTFQLDHGWLFDRLTEELRIGRPDRRCLIHNVLWQLGIARTGTAFWTAFIARNVEAHFDRILGELQQAGAAFPGLVLTSSTTVPHRVRLPNGHRWVPLADLLEVSGGQLGFREAVIRAALSGKGARQLVPRPPGRPGVPDLVLEELTRRQQAGETCSLLGAEAAAIQKWLRTAHPERGPRSPGRIENIIRERYAEWASRDPRSTK
jgi:hypothetical protein